MIEDEIEKLSTPPLVHDCATPEVADDPDGAEGHVVTCVAEPNDGDILVWDNADRKWRPVAGGGATGTPVTVSDGMGGFVLLFDSSGNVIYA